MSVVLHGPRDPRQPIVLDSPHSGTDFPADFDPIVSEFDLRDGEDAFVDQLYLPATELGIPLLAATAARTYLDANRNAGDIDLSLIEGGVWPHAYAPSGKAGLGKALVWRTLDDGRAIYGRKLKVDEVSRRIEAFHQPYHRELQRLIDTAHQRFGVCYHINCHSMNAVAGTMGEGGAGSTRADFVLGDRDGTTCDPAFTAFVRDTVRGLGYTVEINRPYKGVELVRAYSRPAAGRHSLQVEINKRLYMHEATRTTHTGFARLQRDLTTLVAAVSEFAAAATAVRRSG